MKQHRNFFSSVTLVFWFVASTQCFAESDPCQGVQKWRQKLCAFSKANLVHSAWGYEHSLRDYTLAKRLEKESKIQADDAVLFAASMLHDIGGFDPFALSGVDHALRSTEVVDPILVEVGFPMEKAEAVKTAMLTHSYYEQTVPKTPEAILLHDADCLDFVGSISAMRILSIVGHEPSIPSVKNAIKLLESLYAEAPRHLYSGKYAIKLGLERARELRQFLDLVAKESFGFGIP